MSFATTPAAKDTKLQIAGIKKFDGNNYERWIFDVKLVLQYNMAWNITIGIETEPDGRPILLSAPAFEDEKTANMKFKAYEEPHELWETIKIDQAAKMGNNAYEIRNELNEIRLSDVGSVRVYAQQIQHDIQELFILESLDRKPNEVLRMLLVRETEVQKKLQIPAGKSVYNKGNKRPRHGHTTWNNKKCTYCHQDGHDVSECFRQK
ncbi:hypothetical protein BZA05DRAFT_432742 [Tricharina praecox]|uniref:uncharacterized protein n=1 Tax=Tricharina praecox TaxID=43433 RepID=UPI0022207C00|nr:uncharacterized protein BZA05DRAFT_432742 [Tricharina praecox]KAI5858917.1 hypothetical protein BZA05DRAFT_432742 [Tricharina praecox]